MPLTRTHIAFLGIISIFTGIVGPGVYAGSAVLSYLMTDMRAIAYMILIVLILAFFCAAMRRWRLYRICVVFIVLWVILLGGMTIFSPLESIKTGDMITGMSWGWIFLIIGSILLSVSYQSRDISTEESSFSDAIDTVIGMVWGFALACIAGILILSSLSYFGRSQSHDIIRDLYTSGELQIQSGGIAVSPASTDLPFVDYERASDTFLSITSTGGERIWRLQSKNHTETGTLIDGRSPFLIGNKLYMRDVEWRVYSWATLILGSRVSTEGDVVLQRDEKRMVATHKDGILIAPDAGGILTPPIVLSRDATSIAWTISKNMKKYIIKDGVPFGTAYDRIYSLDTSRTGDTTLALVQSWSDTLIIKNGIPLSPLAPEYLTGSYQSNGSNFLITSDKNGIKKVHHDMVVVSRDLEEVRETFLEKDGGSYAYFGRPLGEKYYCLFTRYRGNLCGIEAYMNPIVGADGGSIIFAGKKDGVWSIYRNTDTVIKNTNYTQEDISYDYVYYDATNPRTYLFIIYDKNSHTYTYLKNGNILPWVWDDISTDVSFGYDNHILTAAKDATGWHIIEL